MTRINQYLSGISLNFPIKRLRLVEWIKSQDPIISNGTHLTKKEHIYLKRNSQTWYQRMENNTPFNRKTEKSSSSYPKFRQSKFQTKLIKRDIEGHHKLGIGATQKRMVTIINIQTPNTNTPNFIKDSLNGHKNQTKTNTITIRELHSMSQIVRSHR